MFKTLPPQSARRWLATTFTAIAASVFGFLAPASAASGSALPPAKTFPPYAGVDRSLIEGVGSVRVLIHVAGANATTAAAGADVRRAVTSLPTRGQLERLADASPAVVASVGAAIEARRHRALSTRQPAADAALERQVAVRRAAAAAGGRVLEQDPITGTITAMVPRRSLRALQARRDVAAITEAPSEFPLGLGNITAATGAPSFWAAGFLGGRGAADTAGPDLALIGDRIYQHHPAFNGITFQTPADATALCDPTIRECAHGTQVAGMAFSRGVANGTTDAEQKGVAPGVDTVLDADLEYWASGAWLVGLDQSGGDGLHAPQPGADDPAEVVNASYGQRATEDDTPAARGYDYFATGFGLTSTISAGNAGPGGYTLSSPCIAYDSICVGAFRVWAPGDLRIADFSSRGPTVGGRKKPDLVADGVVTTANPKWQSDGMLWVGVNGTSFAAPQVAGAATLLAGSGVTHHLAHKAVLINSARQGRTTDTDAMGTQTYWQPDWGWGALDLTAALEQRSALVPSSAAATGTAGHHTVAEIAEGDVHFYEASTQATGDRTTLVWDRRAVGCTTLGCPEGSSAMTLTNLNLYETTAAGAARTGTHASSTSAIDNVEQVRSPGAASVIYKVKAASAIDGVIREPYSLASRRPMKRLATPRPRVSVTTTASQARPGDDVTVSAAIANPSPDLAAGDVTATLQLPAGAELISGAASRSIGSLAAGASRSESWTIRFAADGSHDIRVAVAASALSESLPASGAKAVTVDGTAPTPSLAGPSGSQAGSALAVSWGATDTGTGTASHDVEVSVNGGPFSAWLSQTTATSGTYNGQPGSSYQFRARARDRLGNLSAWTTGATVSIALPPAPPPTSTPTPAPAPSPAVSAPAGLRVTAAKLTARTVTVTGRLAYRATGRLTIRYSTRIRGRTLKTSKTITATRGRYSSRLPLPTRMRAARTGKVTVTYAGDARHLAQTVSKRVRR